MYIEREIAITVAIDIDIDVDVYIYIYGSMPLMPATFRAGVV